MIVDLKCSRILLTGGAGFLGSYVHETLRARGAENVTIPRTRDCDLRDQVSTRRLFDEVRPTVVIHLAAKVGGIGANRRHPGSFFRDNMSMGLNVVEEARRISVQKVLIAGTVCAYPKHTPVPFREDDLWNGYPEETNAPYGIAKKALLVMAQAYREEFGCNDVMVFPVNLYGPRDNFDIEDSHVIPAMIRKFVEAGARNEDEVVLWGDGSPTREFLYVEDAAEGIVLATERYDEPAPVNLGSGREISMKELASTIAAEVGFAGKIRWDSSRPNGQPRRCLDVSRAASAFGFTARTAFSDGLRKTIGWYRSNRASIQAAETLRRTE